MVLEDAQDFEQQVAEVGGIHDLQALLILGIELAAQAIGKAMGFTGRNLVGHKPTVFPAVDEAGQLARGPALFVDVFGLEQLLEQADLVIGIENGKAGFEAGQFGMGAQDLDADGMEGAEPGHALDHAADQVADALLHFARRLVGEGDGQNLAGPGLAGGQDMGKPGGEHAGFAGAGAGQHQQAGHRLISTASRCSGFRPLK